MVTSFEMPKKKKAFKINIKHKTANPCTNVRIHPVYNLENNADIAESLKVSFDDGDDRFEITYPAQGPLDEQKIFAKKIGLSKKAAQLSKMKLDYILNQVDL